MKPPGPVNEFSLSRLTFTFPSLPHFSKLNRLDYLSKPQKANREASAIVQVKLLIHFVERVWVSAWTKVFAARANPTNDPSFSGQGYKLKYP